MKRTTFVAAKIDQARRLLGLGERASKGEIKAAYRHTCKQCHPDVVKDKKTGTRRMKDINAAYRLLLEYCESYRVSFSPEEVEAFDPEKWWSRRFGDNIYSPFGEDGSGE